MDYIKNFIILGAFIVIVFLLMIKGCDNRGVKTITKEFHHTDTTYLPGRIDTVFVQESHKDLQPTSITVVDSSFKPEGMDLSDTNVFWSDYVYTVKDSLLEATILARSQTRPIIDLDYKLKTFNQVDTLMIKDSVYVEKVIDKNKLFFGGGLSVRPMMRQVYVGANFYEKHGNLFEANVAYDFNSNSPIVSVGYKKIISFRKK
jgi:hypothetical protein